MISIPERLKVEGEDEKKSFDNFDFNLRCASPGIIESFDSATQTVQVRVAIRERIKINGVLEDAEIPLLLDVPLVLPRAGGYILTMPVQAGDECLVIFSDTCIDAWFQSGGVQNQMSLRRHDLSDGFAVLAPWSQPKVLSNYSTDSAQLRNETGDHYIELKSSEMNLVFGSSTIKLSDSGVEINGDSVKIQDKEFLTHHHSEVSKGGDNTGDVV